MAAWIHSLEVADVRLSLCGFSLRGSDIFVPSLLTLFGCALYGFRLGGAEDMLTLRCTFKAREGERIVLRLVIDTDDQSR